MLPQADTLAAGFRTRGRRGATTIRVGAIDSAAAGLIPTKFIADEIENSGKIIADAKIKTE